MLYAPAHTPKEIVERLHREMQAIMSDPEMQKKASAIGLLPLDPPSIDETLKYMAAERDKWGSLVRRLNLEGTM
jgi:tripartite-type tricarboxylate transporter receptor subunit TctC